MEQGATKPAKQKYKEFYQAQLRPGLIGELDHDVRGKIAPRKPFCIYGIEFILSAVKRGATLFLFSPGLTFAAK